MPRHRLTSVQDLSFEKLGLASSSSSSFVLLDTQDGRKQGFPAMAWNIETRERDVKNGERRNTQ